MCNIQDIHTHNHEAVNAIINFDPTVDSFILKNDKFYSVGIHPWNSSKADEFYFDKVSYYAALPNFLAIGETGIDTIKGGDIHNQINIFKFHVNLSENLNKPLIIHCVKAFNYIINLHNQFSPRQKWIIHGFRGKPQLAQQLISHGLYLSFGKMFNQDSLYLAISNNKAFRETD
ncbi:MAG: TatD family hydrolase [Muribaculaceae bacterium]|nr:TatD family hydrolase [Muribaculaceae bacterium]